MDAFPYSSPLRYSIFLLYMILSLQLHLLFLHPKPQGYSVHYITYRVYFILNWQL